MSEDRYDPLPGLTGLLPYLRRRLSRRQRRIGLATLAGMLVLVAGAVAVLAPRIDDAKERDAVEERREELANREAERRRLERDSRPLRGRAAAPPASASPARQRSARERLLVSVAGSITGDAREREKRRELDGPIRRTHCDPFPPSTVRADPQVDLSQSHAVYECVAVTGQVPQSATLSGVISGYPFRAAVDFTDGTYAWCRVAGRPGEGGLTSPTPVPVPRLCSSREAG